MNQRKLEALRALAERPGTPAEGRLAKEILARLEGHAEVTEEGEKTSWYWFERFLKTHSNDDLLKGVRAPSICECGAKVPRGLRCANLVGHQRIAAQIRALFPRGVRVYYNYWAYPSNCPGTVSGYSHYWNWIRIKFDHLKNKRSIPIYSPAGWHLSMDPVEQWRADLLANRYGAGR